VQAVLEREPHSEVGGQAQGADDLGGAQLLGRRPSTVRTHAAETTEDSAKLDDMEPVGPLHRRSSRRTAADKVIDLATATRFLARRSIDPGPITRDWRSTRDRRVRRRWRLLPRRPARDPLTGT
jgi:hypothetical protein